MIASPLGIAARLLATPAPDPDRARELLARELSRPRYQESLTERFARWVDEVLDLVQRTATSSGGFGVVTAVVVAVALVALLGLALSRLRRGSGREVRTGEVFTTARRSAAQHRAAARTALVEGRHDDCVLEAVRALTAQLVERGLLHDTVGLTVLEATSAAAVRFPQEADALQRLRVAFEDTRYGDRHVDETLARASLATEERVQHASPGVATSATSSPAVPS